MARVSYRALPHFLSGSSKADEFAEPVDRWAAFQVLVEALPVIGVLHRQTGVREQVRRMPRPAGTHRATFIESFRPCPSYQRTCGITCEGYRRF